MLSVHIVPVCLYLPCTNLPIIVWPILFANFIKIPIIKFANKMGHTVCFLLGWRLGILPLYMVPGRRPGRSYYSNEELNWSRTCSSLTVADTTKIRVVYYHTSSWAFWWAFDHHSTDKFYLVNLVSEMPILPWLFCKNDLFSNQLLRHFQSTKSVENLVAIL